MVRQASLQSVKGCAPHCCQLRPQRGSILRQRKRLSWLQRQKERLVLLLLGRFSRPCSGILLDGSGEERKVGRRGLQLTAWKRAENSIMANGRGVGSAVPPERLGLLPPDLGFLKIHLCRGQDDRLGLLTKTPSSGGLLWGRPSRSPLSQLQGFLSPRIW